MPELDLLPYEPGQFVSLSHQFGDKLITRAYSIASPSRVNRFELCLNEVNDGAMSPWLFRMQPGDLVDMKGPLGYFTYRQPPADSIFVATGTGIAPYRGMLLHYLPEHPDVQFDLVFGVRHEHSLMYRAEFEKLQAEHANFRFHPTLSRPESNWTGLTGHVQPHVMELLGNRQKVNVYICGLTAMVDEMRSLLKAAGLDRKQIIVEKYD